MTGDPQEPIDLDAVREPATPPPEAPDERTEQERIAEREDSESDRLTRMAKSAAYRSIVVAERENKRLSDQLRYANAELQRLHQQIEQQGPQHALLRQAFHDLKGNFSIAALLMTAGGILVSIAGAISDATWKPITLYGGITTFFIGFLFTLFTFWWVRPQS